ncbi:MAG: hypothetical protein ACE5GB_05505 [Acidimicrobiales bacterium]
MPVRRYRRRSLLSRGDEMFVQGAVTWTIDRDAPVIEITGGPPSEVVELVVGDHEPVGIALGSGMASLGGRHHGETITVRYGGHTLLEGRLPAAVPSPVGREWASAASPRTDRRPGTDTLTEVPPQPLS